MNSVKHLIWGRKPQLRPDERGRLDANERCLTKSTEFNSAAHAKAEALGFKTTDLFPESWKIKKRTQRQAALPITPGQFAVKTSRCLPLPCHFVNDESDDALLIHAQCGELHPHAFRIATYDDAGYPASSLQALTKKREVNLLPNR